MAALAGIGRLPDTIEDRAVIIRMRRRAPNEAVRPYRLRRDAPALKKLGERVHAWARSHHDVLLRAVPEMPLEDRAADTWEALIAIADQAGGSWPDAARFAAVRLTAEADDTNDATIGTQLLADIRTAFAGRDVMRTEELLTALNSSDEAPWSTYGSGHALTARALGLILRDFDVRPGKFRHNGDQIRGFTAADFADAWARYLPASPQRPVPPAPPAPAALFPQVNGHTGAGRFERANPPHPRPNGDRPRDCDDHRK